MRLPRNRLLDLAAAGSLTVAAAHVVAIVAGGPAYRYMGAPQLGASADAGSPVPALVTACVTIVFVAFGMYALAGGGRIAPLPSTRSVNFLIGGIYTLRGLAVIADVVGCVRQPGYPVHHAAFSAISLAIGLLYVFGASRVPRSPA